MQYEVNGKQVHAKLLNFLAEQIQARDNVVMLGIRNRLKINFVRHIILILSFVHQPSVIAEPVSESSSLTSL